MTSVCVWRHPMDVIHVLLFYLLTNARLCGSVPHASFSFFLILIAQFSSNAIDIQLFQVPWCRANYSRLNEKNNWYCSLSHRDERSRGRFPTVRAAWKRRYYQNNYKLSPIESGYKKWETINRGENQCLFGVSAMYISFFLFWFHVTRNPRIGG